MTGNVYQSWYHGTSLRISATRISSTSSSSSNVEDVSESDSDPIVNDSALWCMLIFEMLGMVMLVGDAWAVAIIEAAETARPTVESAEVGWRLPPMSIERATSRPLPSSHSAGAWALMLATRSVLPETSPRLIARASARAMLDCVGWMKIPSGLDLERGLVCLVAI